MTELQPHEYASYYPMMDEQEFKILCDDIKDNGYRQDNPIIIFEGAILDGRNRYNACNLINVLPMFMQFTGTDEEAFQYAKSSNLTRKHWTKDVLSTIGAELLPVEKARAKAAMSAGGGDHGNQYTKKVAGCPNTDTPPEKKKAKRSSAEAGKKVGVSKGMIERAAKLLGKHKDLFEQVKNGKLKLAKAERTARERDNKETRDKPPEPTEYIKSPRLIVARAEDTTLESNSVDIIITSPPYNLGSSNWPMGGGDNTSHNGIEYDNHTDEMSEGDYQKWQVECLREMYRVAKDGASLFYNHKVRQYKGGIIHPMQWIELSDWTVRQEIIWDRRSTHNHVESLFWQHDERIYWMTKGKPNLPNRPIGKPTIFKQPFKMNTWHPAPFPDELPKYILEAIGRDGITVLDPFAGSCTTLKVALSFGYEAIGVDISAEYLETARKENQWTKM